jgi:hypothetical protein
MTKGKGPSIRGVIGHEDDYASHKLKRKILEGAAEEAMLGLPTWYRSRGAAKYFPPGTTPAARKKALKTVADHYEHRPDPGSPEVVGLPFTRLPHRVQLRPRKRGRLAREGYIPVMAAELASIILDSPRTVTPSAKSEDEKWLRALRRHAAAILGGLAKPGATRLDKLNAGLAKGDKRAKAAIAAGQASPFDRLLNPRAKSISHIESHVRALMEAADDAVAEGEGRTEKGPVPGLGRLEKAAAEIYFALTEKEPGRGGFARFLASIALVRIAASLDLSRAAKRHGREPGRGECLQFLTDALTGEGKRVTGVGALARSIRDWWEKERPAERQTILDSVDPQVLKDLMTPLPDEAFAPDPDEDEAK